MQQRQHAPTEHRAVQQESETKPPARHLSPGDRARFKLAIRLRVLATLAALLVSLSTAHCETFLDRWQDLLKPGKLPRHDTPAGLQRLATAILLENLPETYEDDRKWGMTKRRWDGLKVRADGLKIRTKRRWKEVNHGTWKRFKITQIDPQENFDFAVGQTRTLEDGRVQFPVRLTSKINAYARLSRWNRGIRVASVSLDADARVTVVALCRLDVDLDPSKFPPDVILQPEIVDADIQISRFDVNRISHFDGPIARELGGNLKQVLEQKIEEKRPKLVQRINRQIVKHEDDLRLSLHDAIKERLKQSDKASPKEQPSETKPVAGRTAELGADHSASLETQPR